MKIKIDSLGSHGEGVGTFDGIKVFVEGGLPGEELSVKLTKKKRNYSLATLEQIEKRAPERVAPHCPLFGSCGGCQLMHLSYEGQLKAKRRRVVDALERIGHFKGIEVNPIVPSPQTLHYRNKISFPVVFDSEGIKMGLYRHHSHEIIPFEKCPIHCKTGEKVAHALLHHLPRFPELRHIILKTALHANESLLIFVTTKKTPQLQTLIQKLEIPEVVGIIENIHPDSSNVVLGGEFHLLWGKDHVIEKMGDLSFKISAPSFFQVNTEQAEALFSHAIKIARIEKHHTVLDAFCGVGTLALFASAEARKVVGIEAIPLAIEDAKYNADLNGKTNCNFYLGTAETLFSRMSPCDIAFLNPPRKGCDPTLLAAISQHLPARIVYISCDPATLARDLALLSNSYIIKDVTPFDMFPQTMHVETVVLLEASKEADHPNHN